MHQTTLERIEQELKKIKRQLQCGTQFFETVEEFPEVGVPCAIYVDKSSGAFYVYDTATSTYITADAGEDVDFSLTTTGTSGPATLVGTILNIPQYQSVLTNPVTGTGTAGQVSYWSGTGTQTGSNNLFWDNANGRLGYQTTSPVYLADFLQTSTQALEINNINTAIGRSFFFGYDTGTARRGIQVGVNSTGAPFINAIDGSSGNVFIIQPYGGYAIISEPAYIGATSYGKLRIITPSNGVQLGLYGFTVTDNLIRLKAVSGQTGDIIQFRDSNENVISKFDSSAGLGIGIGTTLSARLHVRGSSTTSSTTALLVQNSTPTELFKVADNGAWNFNGDGIVKGSGNTSATTALTVQNSDGTTILTVRNDNRVIASNGFRVGGILTSAGIFPDGGTTNFEGLLIRSSNGQDFTGTDITISNGQGNGTATSGTRTLVGISRGFAPTSGTGVWNTLSIAPTINQTGGANGITRGLYVNPTLTAAADWRGIEISTGATNTVVLGKNTGSAAVEVTSTTQGFLPPRMTTAQRNLIATPSAGLVIFNTTTTKLECFDGAVWQAAW